METCRKKGGEKAQTLKAERKEVNAVRRSGQGKECRELALINPTGPGKRLNTVANFRTVPVKYDSDIQSK